MNAICTMELEMPNHEIAITLAKALELDNVGYVESRVEGNIIIAKVEADNIMALRNTVDDYLACLTVAKNSLL